MRYCLGTKFNELKHFTNYTRLENTAFCNSTIGEFDFRHITIISREAIRYDAALIGKVIHFPNVTSIETYGLLYGSNYYSATFIFDRLESIQNSAFGVPATANSPINIVIRQSDSVVSASGNIPFGATQANTLRNLNIYVPDILLEDYKSTFSSYVSRFFPLSEYD